MTRIFAMIGVILCVLLAAPAYGQDYDDKALEDRARAVGQQLRCVVCQNESIEESDAELAADMRRRVRDSLREGRTEAEIIEEMRARYGDYVLLKPPVQGNTLILWVGPFALIIGLMVWWAVMVRRRGETPSVAELTDEDRVRLNALREEAQP